jgi:hypothetical protein
MRTDCHRGFTSTSFIYTLEFLWKKKIKFPYLLNITHWVTLKGTSRQKVVPVVSLDGKEQMQLLDSVSTVIPQILHVSETSGTIAHGVNIH